MPRLAANLSFMFTEHAFPDRFAAAARCGFVGVEYISPLAYPKSEIAALLEDNGLSQALFNAGVGDWDAGERGLAALPGAQARFRDEFARALDYAQALHCARLHVMAGLAQGTAARETYLANLDWAAAQAGPVGVALTIEPINEFDMPGYFLTRTAQARDIIAELGRPELGLQYDIYHAQRTEGALADTIAANLGIIGHVQIAAVPGRNEPDTGEIAMDFLLDRLDALGYAGWVGCEYRPRGRTEDGLGWARRWGIRTA